MWLVSQEEKKKKSLIICSWKYSDIWPSSQTPASGLKAKPRYVIYLFNTEIGQETTIKHTF
jgi:hypothetical protein